MVKSVYLMGTNKTKPVIRFLLFVLVGYCFTGAAVYFQQDTLLFHPRPISDQTALSANSRYAYQVSQEGISLHGWLFRLGKISAKTPLIIYYGGNAEEVSTLIKNKDQWSAGALLLMNYRGYGNSEGKPSAEALKQDALLIFDQVLAELAIQPSQVVLVGRSLGSGIATYVTAKRQVASTILITPYDSMANVAQHHYPWLPVSILLKHRFDSASLAKTITSPALILLASTDQIVPHRFSSNLLQQWAGATTSTMITQSDHNSITNQPEYWQAIRQFIRQKTDNNPPSTL